MNSYPYTNESENFQVKIMETLPLRHLKTNMIGLTHNLGILLSVENLLQASAYHIHGCHHFVDFNSLIKNIILSLIIIQREKYKSIFCR